MDHLVSGRTRKKMVCSTICPSGSARGKYSKSGSQCSSEFVELSNETAYANSHLPYNDVRGCDEFFNDVAPNENRFVGRDFIVNDANGENMVETNIRDDLYDDVLRNEMNEANGRLIEAQKKRQ